MRYVAALLAIDLSSCAGNASAVNALVNTSVALIASATNRAAGRCYASCPHGTRCDTATTSPFTTSTRWS